MLYIVTQTNEHPWHVNERVPAVQGKVMTVQADGHELEWLIQNKLLTASDHAVREVIGLDAQKIYDAMHQYSVEHDYRSEIDEPVYSDLGGDESEFHVSRGR